MKPATRRRIDRVSRSILRVNKVCIVNLNDPYDLQTIMHYGGKLIHATPPIASALCDVAHRWTLYLAVFCDSGRERYTKAVELEPQGIYRADRLTDVIREHHTALVEAQNSSHVVSSGWIAFPYRIEFSEEQADRLFDAAIEVSREYQNATPMESAI